MQKEEEYSDEPAGTIVKQNPKAGRTVKEGQKITLTVSLGTQYITIPETKNMVAEDAEQTLKDMGLRVTKKPMVDATVAPGAVIYTQPAAGETVTGDSMVIVYVSRQDKDKTQPCAQPDRSYARRCPQRDQGQVLGPRGRAGQRTASRYRFEPEPGPPVPRPASHRLSRW